MGILICGLNGAGKSTLGKALASRMGYEFIDNEDLYFPQKGSVYDYSNPRSKEEVVHALESRIRDNTRFVFAAVKGDYGSEFIHALDHIVLVDVPKDVRSRRVRARSFQKFGDRISPGGELYDKEQKWFAFVDGRPDDYVLAWLETIECPVIRVDGTLPAEDNIEYLMTVLDGERKKGTQRELSMQKNANVMESVMNAENITQNQNFKDNVIKRKRD